MFTLLNEFEAIRPHLDGSGSCANTAAPPVVRTVHEKIFRGGYQVDYRPLLKHNKRITIIKNAILLRAETKV